MLFNNTTNLHCGGPCGGWLQVVEFSPTSIVVVNESNIIVWMNAMAYTLFKVSRETILDNPTWDSLVFSLEPAGEAPGDLLSHTDGKPPEPFKALITDELNTRVEITINKVEFGDSTYACCYISPDTQEENVLQCSLDAVVQADLEKNIIGWNSAAENTFGYSEKEIAGKPLSTIIPRRDSKTETDICNTLLNHKSKLVNRMVGVAGQRKDGQEIPLEMAVTSLNYANGKKYFSFFIKDLSQQKYIEKMKSVEEASQAKSVFVSSISHELRSPLNTIFGFGQLLTEMSLSSEQLEYVHGIITASEALIQLVSDMADLSKIEARKIDLEAVPFSVATVVSDVVNSGLVMARSKHVEVASLASFDCPTKVIGDPRRLKQILVNLVNNGIKFTETGSVVVTVEAKQDEVDCVELMFQVTDTGIGIAQEDVGKLFKRFSQLNSQRYGGSGLGLAISAELVRLMGGEIGVMSGGRGKGSTLWFSCTLEVPPSAQVKERAKKPQNPFDVLVAYKDETVGSKLRSFVSESYNIENGQFKNSMDELLEYLDGAEAPPKGRQMVILVDEAMEDFAEKFSLAKEKSKSYHHFVVLRESGSDKQARGPCSPDDVMLMKPINQAKLHSSLDPFNLLVEMKTNGRVCPSQECKGVAREGPKVKILVAEDNTLNFLITQKMLSSAGYECHQAGNGYEVLQQLSRGCYSLVLMDCMMPRLDGYATTKMIRESALPAADASSDDGMRAQSGRRGSTCAAMGGGGPPRRKSISIASIPRGIPVVAMTANAMRGDREKCLSVGMDDYLSKPFQKQQLIDIVQKWVPRQAACS